MVEVQIWRTTISSFMQPPINSVLLDPNIQLLEHNLFCHTKIQFFMAKKKRKVALQKYLVTNMHAINYYEA